MQRKMTETYKLKEYIRWVLIELSCNYCPKSKSRIDFPQKSRLEKYLKKYNNIEKAIDKATNKLINNNILDIDEYTQTFIEKDFDYLYDIKITLFDRFIEYIGLCEINNLNVEYYELFMDKFFEMNHDSFISL